MHTNTVVKLKVQDAGCCIPRVAAEEVFAWPKLRGRLPKVAVLYLQTLQTPAKNRAPASTFPGIQHQHIAAPAWRAALHVARCGTDARNQE